MPPASCLLGRRDFAFIHRVSLGFSCSLERRRVGAEKIPFSRREGRPRMKAVGKTLERRLRSARDRGMSTAEYAVGTVAAAAFAALLFKLVTSSEVRSLLMGIIRGALQSVG